MHRFDIMRRRDFFFEIARRVLIEFRGAGRLARGKREEFERSSSRRRRIRRPSFGSRRYR